MPRAISRPRDNRYRKTLLLYTLKDFNYERFQNGSANPDRDGGAKGFTCNEYDLTNLKIHGMRCAHQKKQALTFLMKISGVISRPSCMFRLCIPIPMRPFRKARFIPNEGAIKGVLSFVCISCIL